MSEYTLFHVQPSDAAPDKYILVVAPAQQGDDNDDYEAFICSKEDLEGLRTQISNMIDPGRQWQKEKDNTPY